MNTGDLRRGGVFLLVAVLPALYMTGLRLGGAPENPLATVQMLIQGTAATPFQYRALAPWCLRALMAFFGLMNSDLPQLLRTWEFCAILGVFLTLRAWLVELKVGALAEAGAFAFFFVFPYLYSSTLLSRIYYPSDLPSIVLFTAGLILLRQRRWLPFGIVFGLATLNRETSLFLLVIDLLVSWDERPRRPLVIRLLGFTALWLLIKFGLGELYAANPGPGWIAENPDPKAVRALPAQWSNSRPYANLLVLGQATGLLTWASMGGFLWVPVLCWWRAIDDRFVRRAQLVSLPFIAAMLLVGNALEMRIYAELLPVWLAGLAVALNTRLRSGW